MAQHIGTNHFLEISRGRIDNIFTTHRYGVNPNVGTTEATIWTGPTTLRPRLSAQQIISLVSTSANDIAGGTGSRTILFDGLDSAFNPLTEIVTLNGTTPVNTVNQYQYINRMLSISAGSAGINQGTITASFGGVVYENMVPGAGRNETAVYTVPAGVNAYITDFYVGVGSGKDAQFSAYFIDPTGSHFRADSLFVFQRAVYVNLPNNPRIPSGVTLEFRARLLSGSAAACSTSFDLIVVTE